MHLQAAREHDEKNAVNAIVVSHRVLDTMGEITVIATSGIGVLALLRLRLKRKERP